jgi:hypothetical protein
MGVVVLPHWDLAGSEYYCIDVWECGWVLWERGRTDWPCVWASYTRMELPKAFPISTGTARARSPRVTPADHLFRHAPIDSISQGCYCSPFSHSQWAP